MRRAKQLLLHTSAMTATSLLMRTIALVFQVYVAGRIGAAGIGLFQLVRRGFQAFGNEDFLLVATG